LLQLVGWPKFRDIKKNGLPVEAPEEYDPDAKFVNTGFVLAPANDPEHFERPPSSYMMRKHVDDMDPLKVYLKRNRHGPKTSAWTAPRIVHPASPPHPSVCTLFLRPPPVCVSQTCRTSTK